VGSSSSSDWVAGAFVRFLRASMTGRCRVEDGRDEERRTTAYLHILVALKPVEVHLGSTHIIV
jgi:hypothetical protein